MKKQLKKGFSIIELLIAVSLGAILMTSILVFVSNSIGSSIKNKNIIDNKTKNIDFKSELLNIVDDFSGETYGTGNDFGIYKKGYFIKNNSSWPLLFIGEKSFSGYCDSFSGIIDQNNDYKKLIIKKIRPNLGITFSGILNGDSYFLDIDKHVLKKGNEIILGTGYPGSKLDKTNPKNTQLKNPSSIGFLNNYIYIADTLNDRVLVYSGSNYVNQFLGVENSISKPNSFYINGNTMYIGSSGNGKIFKIDFSSSNYESLSGNTISLIEEGKKFPYLSGLILSDFNSIDLTGSLKDNNENEIISDFIVKNLEIKKVGNTYNFIINYFENYNCIDEDKNKEKEFIIKKFIK